MKKHPILPSLRGPCRRTTTKRNAPRHRSKTLTLALAALLTFSQTCSPFTTALAESGSSDPASPDVGMTESVNDLQPVDVNESPTATDDVTYITEHMDKSLVGDGELKANDILTTVTTMVSKDSGVTTIDDLWKNDPDGTPVSERAFEGQYYNDVLLYEAGPDSDYYVARANSLGKKPLDSVAVRNDTTGTVYDDVKVDADNGLVYVPKKYRVTNEDGKLVLDSVRVQLLYAVGDDTTTPIDVTVDADDVRGDIAPTGTAEADVLDDQTSINLSDGDNKISQNTIDSVTVNGVEYPLGSIANGDMVEYTDDGNLVVNMPPACVTSVTVNASDNLGKDIASAIGSAAALISPTKASAASYHYVNEPNYINGWWITNGTPKVGATIHTAGHNTYTNGGVHNGHYTDPIGGGPPWSTDDGQSYEIWKAVANNASVELDKLVAYDNPKAGVERTATINPQTVKTSDGVTVQTKIANLNLYCAHAHQPNTEAYADDKGQTIRILKTVDKGGWYDVWIGVINPSLNTQSGAGLFKVHWVKPGKITVSKTSSVNVSNNGNYSLAGAQYTVYSDVYCTKAVTTLTLPANGVATAGSLPAGTYYVKETKAPKGFSLDSTVYTANVTGNAAAVINVKDAPLYGAILLDKQSSEEVDLSSGDYSLEGAEYGVYSDKDCTKLVKTITTSASSSVETTASGVTTDSTTLPLGSTVIMRPNAIADGATYNYVWSRNGSWLAGEWDSSANHAGGNITDTSWSFKPTKAGTYSLYVDVTINGKKITYGPQTITISDGGTPVDNSLMTDHAQGLLAGLKAGTYYVKETKAPKGFSLDKTTHEVSVQPGVTSRVDSVEVPVDLRTGLQIVKKSSNPSLTSDNSYYSLEGAEYGVYSDNDCTQLVKSVTTDKDGKSPVVELPAGTYYVKETKAPKGFELSDTVYTAGVTEHKIVTVNASDHPEIPTTSLIIHKSSTQPQLTDDNSCYTLAGAEFTVYHGRNLVATLTTDENGTARIDDLPAGTYHVMETSASRGFKLNTTSFKVDLFNIPYTVNVPEEPITNQLGFSISKHTAATDWFPSEPVQGAEFTVKYYDNTEGKTDGSAKYTWTLISDADGMIYLDDAHAKDSCMAAIPMNADSTAHALPIGTYTMQETKAPEGFSLPLPSNITCSQTSSSAQVDGTDWELIDDGTLGLVAPTYRLTLTATAANTAAANVTNAFDVLEPARPQTTLTTSSDAKSCPPTSQTLKDTVICTNLELRNYYRLDGKLVDVTTGKTLATSTTKFTYTVPRGVPPTGTATKTVTFTDVDLTTAAGHKVVCYETLWHCTSAAYSDEGASLMAIEMDATSDDQSITVEQPTTTGLEIIKSSTKPYVTDGDNDYSLEGAEYGVYLDASCTQCVATIVTDEVGVGAVTGLPVGTYYVKEAKAPKGYRVDTQEHKVTLVNGTQTELPVQDEPIVETTSLKIHKSSAEPKLTDGNGCYSLEGAEYGVYSDKDCTNAIGTITTDANGNGHLDDVAVGTYYVKETKAPKGFELNSVVTKVTPDSLSATVEVKDVPLNDPVITRITKADSLTTVPVQGAEFTVKYYDNTEGKTDGTPKYTWTFASDFRGRVVWDAGHITDGDLSVLPESMEGSGGSYTFPIGTYTMQETKAPTGYVPPVSAETKISSDDPSGMSQWVQIAKASSPSVGPLYRFVANQDVAASSLNLTNTFNIDESRAPGIDTVLATSDSSKSSEPQTVTLVDHVTMSDLLSGTSYRLDGQLVDATTGEILATATTSFKHTAPADDPTNGDNNQDVTFTDVDLTTAAGHKVVCYETLTRLVTNDDGSIEEQSVAEHKDINDEDQTVTVTPGKNMPETGQQGLALIALLSGAATLALTYCRYKRHH